MIDLVSPVRTILSHIPQHFTAPPPISQVPSFEAVGTVAELTDGDPSGFYRRLGELADEGSTIETTTAQALLLTSACAMDLWNLAQEFIREAMLKAPALNSPVVALQLAMFGVECVGRGYGRVQRWERELDPLAEVLEQRAAVPVEQHINSYSPALDSPPASSTATAELAANAETRETPVESGDNAMGKAAVAAAKSQLGTPYVWGGSQPGGFDCSGLTSWSYAQAGLEIPRTAENQTVGQQVSADQLQEGDLVVWDGHVAMYAGDGQMIEAGDPVQMSPLRTENIGMPFKGFWRPAA
ncbi:C40 family peptidase [Corynebacterium cystitidis]|uniref:C40 family peptidase n=1 Tax=Corynebacterium cystitidis TaxID=35757 RepID=UPI00211E493B|nr:C40 family peptidase [Corynebacterium cystitidis]